MNDELEQHIEKRMREKDRRKRKRMEVSGKSVFLIERLQNERLARKTMKKKSKCQTKSKNQKLN